MPRLLLALGGALALGVLTAATALAGGSAIVVPDEGGGGTPETPIAGQPFEIGFTLLQHGVTPVNRGIVEVVLSGPSGSVVVEAEPTGDGQWVATATLPSEGEWSWTVRMPGGLEIVPMRDRPSVAVAAPPQPLNAPLLAGGLVAGFGLLLLALVVAARSAARPPAGAPADLEAPLVPQRAR